MVNKTLKGGFRKVLVILTEILVIFFFHFKERVYRNLFKHLKNRVKLQELIGKFQRTVEKINKKFQSKFLKNVTLILKNYDKFK